MLADDNEMDGQDVIDSPWKFPTQTDNPASVTAAGIHEPLMIQGSTSSDGIPAVASRTDESSRWPRGRGRGFTVGASSIYDPVSDAAMATSADSDDTEPAAELLEPYSKGIFRLRLGVPVVLMLVWLVLVTLATVIDWVSSRVLEHITHCRHCVFLSSCCSIFRPKRELWVVSLRPVFTWSTAELQCATR